MILALVIGATLLALGIARCPELVRAQLRRLPAPRPTARVSLPDLGPIEHGLKELSEHIGAVHTLAEDRGHEIARLQEGYDFTVTRSFARGVIKTIDLLRDFQAQLKAAHADSDLRSDALDRLEAAADQLCFLLEAHHIEPFTPAPGDEIAKDSLRFEPIGKHPAPSPADVGTVSQLEHPGWTLQLGDSRERVIRPAQVAVYAPADTPNESRSS